MNFGDRLALLRTSRNLSQQALAKELAFSDGAIGMWELNKRMPNLTTLIKIADYFDVSTDYLLGVEKNDILNDFTPFDIQIIKEFHKANDQCQTAILTLLNIPNNATNHHISAKIQKTEPLPLSDINQIASGA